MNAIDAQIVEGLRRAYAHLVRELRAGGVDVGEHAIAVRLSASSDDYRAELVDEPAISRPSTAKPRAR